MHFSAIQAVGFRLLQEGQQVSFEVQRGANGWPAEDIQPLESETQRKWRAATAALPLFDRELAP